MNHRNNLPNFVIKKNK